MKRFKLIIGIAAILCAAAAIYFVLSSDHALLTHPKGTIARSELEVMKKHTFHMLIIIIPTLILLFFTIWKYRAKDGKYEPDHTAGFWGQLILWIIPAIVVVVMAVSTWDAAHELDPYKPLKSDVKPLTIQVVAIDWKWLFIYPEQGIATLNLLQIPEKTPIRLELSADGSPMNSFWIPQLSGQIYAMTGMATQLHIMADEPGVYDGRAAEINGKGLADMTFVVKSATASDFDSWVAEVQRSPLQLSSAVYNDLLTPSLNDPIALYSSVENGLFNQVIMKYMHPHE